MKGSFYVTENELVREFGKDNLEYGRRPTKPTLSFEEVNNRLRNCGNIYPFSNFSDLQCVVLTQLGLFIGFVGNQNTANSCGNDLNLVNCQVMR